MKKEYLKPELEYVDFVTEVITEDEDMDGEMGTSGLPEGWT